MEETSQITEVTETTEKKEIIVNIVQDIENPLKFPWPYEDGSVDKIDCIGILEYIPGRSRATLMDEAYRVLGMGKTMVCVVPYWNTAMGVQDFRYGWPPLVEQSFCFFDKKWREENKLSEGYFAVELECDFRYDFGYIAEAEVASREPTTRDFWVKHYTNVIRALQVTLTKK